MAFTMENGPVEESPGILQLNRNIQTRFEKAFEEAESARLNGPAAVVEMDLKDTPVRLEVADFGLGELEQTGLQILTPSIFEVLPPAGTEACLIRDGYQRLLDRGAAVHAYEHRGYVNDLGTPERYARARADIACGRFRLHS